MNNFNYLSHLCWAISETGVEFYVSNSAHLWYTCNTCYGISALVGPRFRDGSVYIIQAIANKYPLINLCTGGNYHMHQKHDTYVSRGNMIGENSRNVEGKPKAMWCELFPCIVSNFGIKSYAVFFRHYSREVEFCRGPDSFTMIGTSDRQHSVQ